MNIFYTVLLVAIVFHVMDWAQTIKIVENPDKWQEKWNPIIRRYPLPCVVHSWFSLSAIAIAGLALVLLSSYPGIAMIVVFWWMVLELAAFVNNINHGILP
jgi:hypothetical protein